MDKSPESLAKLLNSQGANAMSPEVGVILPPDEDEIADNIIDAMKTGDRDKLKSSLRAHREMMMAEDQDGQVDDTEDTEQ